MIELHLKDGRKLTCDAPATEARFLHAENSRRLERKIGEDWVTVAEVSNDIYAFLFVDEHVTLVGTATQDTADAGV